MLNLARRHRITPAVYVALKQRAEVSASIQSALDGCFAAHCRRVLRFSAELAAILRQFSASGIEAIVYKGPALAQRLYGDSVMREFGDLDFIIRPADVPRARTALQELGLQPCLVLRPRQEQEYLRTGYEYAFGSAAEPNLVELQWQVVPHFYATAFQMEKMFHRSVESKIEGQPARMLCDEDLMLALCVHAAKHCWEQLGMVRDIAVLARRPLDWEWIVAEAQRLGIVRILLVSLVLGRNLLDFELPRKLTAHPGLKASDLFARAIEVALRNGDEPDTESLSYFRLMMRLRERRQDRIRFALRLALTPSVGEWQLVSLPNALFPLYRGIRVMRLLRRTGKAIGSGIFRRFQAPTNHF